MGEKMEIAYFSSIPWTAGRADCENWKTDQIANDEVTNQS